MRNMLFKRNQLLLALASITACSLSHAGLVNSSSIQSASNQVPTTSNQYTSSTAKLAWGGEDSLSTAKAVMYDQVPAASTYSSNSNSSNDSYSYSQSYSSNNNSHNNVQSNNPQSNNSQNSYSSNKNAPNSYSSYSDSNNSYSTATNTYNNSTSTYSNNTTTYNTTPSQYNNGYTGFETFDSNNSYGGSSNSYDKLNISTRSRGVMVVDLVTGEPIYQKNANKSRPIASISKLMTGMVILDAGLDMREEIVIKPFDFKGNGHTKKSSSRMKVGDRLNRAEMLLMTLMKSENPAAKSLARTYPGGYSAFMRAMNQKARSLGMTKAHFGDPTGLDTRNVASPSDLVKMITAASKYDVIRKFSTTASYEFYIANYSRGDRVYTGRNTSRLVREKVYPISISKTGFINEAGRCVVMETQVNGRPAVVVILGASSSANRWRDAENILSGLQYRMI